MYGSFLWTFLSKSDFIDIMFVGFIIHTVDLTKSREQSPSRECDSRSNGQKIPRPLWNIKILYYKNPQVDFILKPLESILLPHARFNIILSLHLCLPSDLVSYFQTEIVCVVNLSSSHSYYMFRPAHFDNSRVKPSEYRLLTDNLRV